MGDVIVKKEIEIEDTVKGKREERKEYNKKYHLEHREKSIENY